MSTITLDQAKDMAQLTLASYKDGAFESFVNHHNYPIVGKLFKGDAEVQTGKVIQKTVSVGKTGNAQRSGIFDKRDSSITNLTVQATVPFVHIDTSMSFAVQEVMMQGGGKGFVDLMKVRKRNMQAELADMLEEDAWSVPLDATDKNTPFGIPYWITKSHTATASEAGALNASGKFTGKNPKYRDGNVVAGGAGGIDSDAYPDKWANWTDLYSNFDKDDLLKKLSRAFRQTKFMSPANVKDATSSDQKYMFYTNDNVLGELEALCFATDDRIGVDLGKYAGRTMFKRIPFEYIDALDENQEHLWGNDPIFGINWDHLKPVIMKGDRFRVSKPDNSREQHNVLTSWIDLTYNYCCDNRQRAGFLLHKTYQ